MGKACNITGLRGGVVTYPAGATFGPRTLSDYEMVWIIQGAAVWHPGDRDVSCGPGSMVLARPGMHDAFTWDRDRPTRHAFFHFTLEQPPRDWTDPAGWPVKRDMPEDDIVRPLFRHVLTAVSMGEATTTVSPHLQRVIETLLDAFLTGQVSQAFEHTRDDPEPVQRALSFMRVQLDRDAATPLALPDLARAARVSPEHLCRLFREALDVGPMEAVRLSRLERAVTLLTRSNLNVEQVARRCGFASPYHFSRVFKDVFGQPPTIVRRNVAAGGAPPVSPLLRG